MEKSLSCPTLLLIILLFASLAWGATPKIFVEQDTFNFDTISKGEKVIHTFSFRNDGDAPLNITKVRSSCGCTAAIPSENTIPPGMTGELKATFDSGRFRGEISKTIYLYTDDPVHGVVQFYIRGVVKEEITLKPNVLKIDDIDPLSKWEGEIIISNEGKDPVEITEASATIKGMTLDITSERILPGETSQLKVALDVSLSTHNINGYITLKLSGAHTDTLRVPVSATALKR